MMDVWDSHKIRPSSNPVVPSGRPNNMYHQPALWGCTDCKTTVTPVDLHYCANGGLTSVRDSTPCDDDVHRLCCTIMRTNNLALPTDGDSAVHLFSVLKQHLLLIL